MAADDARIANGQGNYTSGVFVNTKNPDIIYGAGRTEVSRYQWSTGRVQNITPIPVRGSHRAERTQPLVFSPLRPNVMYYAADVLFESGDSGQTWRELSLPVRPNATIWGLATHPADGNRLAAQVAIRRLFNGGEEGVGVKMGNNHKLLAISC